MIDLLAAAGLAAGAVVLVTAALVARRRRALLALLAVVELVVAVPAIAGWLLPDALDRLGHPEEEGIRRAVEAGGVCGGVPLARVTRIDLAADGTLSWSCAVLPFPSWQRGGDVRPGLFFEL